MNKTSYARAFGTGFGWCDSEGGTVWAGNADILAINEGKPVDSNRMREMLHSDKMIGSMRALDHKAGDERDLDRMRRLAKKLGVKFTIINYIYQR